MFKHTIRFFLFLVTLFSLVQCGEKPKGGSLPKIRAGENRIVPSQADDAGITLPATTKILWGVPLAAQSTNYSCGPAAMQSVFAYYGKLYTEEALIKAMASNPKEGTDHHKMAAFSNQIGIKAEVKHNVPLTEIALALAKAQTVVIECQAHDDKGSKDYAAIWDAGHYMVVIGLDEQNIYFMDPSLGGARGYIALTDFMIRWHDLGAKNEKLHQTAIFFDGKIDPAPLPILWSKIP